MSQSSAILHAVRSRLSLAGWLVFGVTLILHSSTPLRASAAEQLMEVQVNTPIEPTSATGLLISSTRVIQKANATLQRTTHGLVVRFPIEPSELDGDTMASAVVLAEDGQTAFGDMRPATIPAARSSYLSSPDCPAEQVRDVSTQSDLALFESLAEIRSQRRAVQVQKVSLMLGGEFLDRLRALERGFGLTYPRPLSAELPPVELIDRLRRLQVAIQSYKRAKPAAPSK